MPVANTAFLHEPAVIVGSVCSLVASLMVISSYALFKDLRKLRYVELLTYVAVNDFLFSICSLLGNVKEGSFDCYFQGIIGSASCVSSAYWTTVITYQLYIACLDGRILRRLKWMRVAGTICPLGFALLPLTTNTYAPDGTGDYCFINSKGIYVVWKILSFYIWILIGVTVQIVLLALIARRLSILRKNSNNVNKIWASLWKLAWYPLIFIICWTPDACINLDSHDRDPPRQVTEFAIMSMILQGFFFGIVFFSCNKVVRDRWYYLIRNNLIALYDALGLDWAVLLSDEEAAAAGCGGIHSLRVSSLTTPTFSTTDTAGNQNEGGRSTIGNTDSNVNTKSLSSIGGGSTLASAATSNYVLRNSSLTPGERVDVVKSREGSLRDSSLTMQRPSLLELPPDVADVEEEVDYIKPKGQSSKQAQGAGQEGIEVAPGQGGNGGNHEQKKPTEAGAETRGDVIPSAIVTNPISANNLETTEVIEAREHSLV